MFPAHFSPQHQSSFSSVSGHWPKHLEVRLLEAEGELLSMGQECPDLPLFLGFSGTVRHFRRAMSWELGHLSPGQALLKLRSHLSV